MITKLELKNFKCFKDLTFFEFSNLNLLTGINGRGKSSLLQSLLLLSQSINNNNQIENVKFNGRYINLGNYDDVKNSETPRSEELFFKIILENGEYAEIKFREDENNEFQGILIHNIIRLYDQNYNGIDYVFDEFVTKLSTHLNISDKYELDTNQLIFFQNIKNIHYIGADRLGPVKYVDKTDFNFSEFVYVGNRGEHTINVLAKDDLPLVNDKLYLGKDSKSVLQQTQEWLSYILEGAVINIEGKEKSSSVLWMLLNNKSNSYKYKPANIGFGYSYVLPLIVSGLIAKPNDIIIVENPEAHLHPKAQSKISEFFARVSSTGVQVFIESHSEHILNGLRISALRKDIDIDNNGLSIHYFNESFGSEKLIMDGKGKIHNWPNGFFDQQELDLGEIFRMTR